MADTPRPRNSLSKDEVRSHDLAAGRRVLKLESDAVGVLADSLDETFCDAVEILAAPGKETPRGRVVVTGMGKSGHVGRKIVATLASTGTPAHLVHPAEASHGDLGMITERDAILALSNSGETHELNDVLAYAKRFSIPVVAMTSNRDSTLAKLSTIVLCLPEQPEAATMGLAPTTSTTMSMALGDALAVALLERKGFTASDFQVFHPGGKLGRQLETLGQLMHTGNEIPLVAADDSVSMAVSMMAAKRFGVVGVLDADGRLAGIFSDGDLSRHMVPNIMELQVRDVMTRAPVTAKADAIAGETIALMNERRITAVFVVDDRGMPEGIVHIHDFLRRGVA